MVPSDSHTQISVQPPLELAYRNCGAVWQIAMKVLNRETGKSPVISKFRLNGGREDDELLFQVIYIYELNGVLVREASFPVVLPRELRCAARPTPETLGKVPVRHRLQRSRYVVKMNFTYRARRLSL